MRSVRSVQSTISRPDGLIAVDSKDCTSGGQIGNIPDDMTEHALAEGDRVRVDIPDETDPDHRFHGRHGEIVSILLDDGPESIDDPRAKRLYRVDLGDTTADFRYWDLRPPIESSNESRDQST